jgi:hypothetical protein
MRAATITQETILIQGVGVMKDNEEDQEKRSVTFQTYFKCQMLFLLAHFTLFLQRIGGLCISDRK